MSLIKRSAKGAPLTAAEHDRNLEFFEARTSGFAAPNLAALLADRRSTAAYPVGSVIRVEQEGWRYKVAAASATDHHLSTAGGVKLNVLPNEDGSYNFKAFNPAGDGTTDDYAKLMMAINAVTIAGAAPFQVSGPTLTIPEAIYKINSTVNLKRYIRIIGNGSGRAIAMGPVFLFARDIKGIIFHRSDTWNDNIIYIRTNESAILTWTATYSNVSAGQYVINDATRQGYIIVAADAVEYDLETNNGVRLLELFGTEKPERTDAAGAIIEGVRIWSQGGTNLDAHGVWMRTAGVCRRVEVRGFRGNGFHIVAAAQGGANPSTEGNCNLFMLDNVYSRENGLNGFYAQGADANAGVIMLGDFTANGKWGVWDRSFLGNTFVGCHSARNGQATVAFNGADKTSVVSYQGARYAANPASATGGDLDGAATLLATVPGTNPNVWKFLDNAGGRFPGSPEWKADQPGGTYFFGGNYRCSGNSRSTFVGCYTEDGDAGDSFMGGSTVIGNAMLSFINGGKIGCTDGGKLEALSLRATDGHTIQIGANRANGDILTFNREGQSSTTWRWKFVNGGLVLDVNNSGAARAFVINGPDTTNQMGTGLAQPYTVEWSKGTVMGVGPNARRHFSGTSAPTNGTYARGDVVWNIGPAAGGTVGWVCTAAGTPGTWKTFGAIAL